MIFLNSYHEFTGLQLDPDDLRITIWMLIEVDETPNLAVLVPDVKADKGEGCFEVFDGDSERGGVVG